MGVFARAFRLAGLPVRMSEGFNPRPRFSLPAPLAVGVEGMDEVLEMDLKEDLAPEELAGRLSGKLPQGIGLLRAERLAPGVKARVTSVTYRIDGGVPPGAVERCAARGQLRSTRGGGKEVDIRPYLRRMSECPGGCELEVLVSNEGTARPAEIAAALCDGNTELPRHLSLVRTTVNLEGLN